LLAGVTATFGLKSFLLPNKFVDGGVVGISMLLTIFTNLPLPLFIVIVNIPFILLAYFNLAKELAIKAIIAIVFLSLCLWFLPLPAITHDKLLVAVFGGFFIGAGIGLAVRGGGVLDGTEILSIFLSRKIHSTVGDVILVINVVIFSVVAFTLGVEIAFYSILTYISASKTTDFFIEGIEEYIAVIIISEKAEEIRKTILYEIERGVTIFKGKRGLEVKPISEESDEIDIIYTVITRLELPKLSYAISKIDSNAFVVMHNVKDTIGGYIKKRPHNVF
jgi:uncharacterized membrane-anchored protein YitT (DUF2179 family)